MATENLNTLGMSDEEFMALDPSSFDNEVVEDNGYQEIDPDMAPEESESDENLDFSEEDQDTLPTDEESDDSEEYASEEQPEDFESEESESDESEEDSTDEDTDESADESDNADTSETDGVDFKAEYERLLAPFNANGQEIRVSNVDDAISLMQRGANYTKKMQELAPIRRIAQMLQNNDLLDESKLNTLIDISAGNVGAIKSLLKEKGIDIDAVDSRYDDGDAAEYKPNDYRVSQESLTVQDTLAELRTQPKYAETLQVISREWDDNSRKLAYQRPEIIGELRKHMESGFYNEVNAVFANEKALGRIPANVADVDAYFYIADNLAKAKQAEAPSTPADKAKTVDNSEAERKAKRKQAASTKKKAPTKAKTAPKNLLSMSDEEFLALDSSIFEEV